MRQAALPAVVFALASFAPVHAWAGQSVRPPAKVVDLASGNPRVRAPVAHVPPLVRPDRRFDRRFDLQTFVRPRDPHVRRHGRPIFNAPDQFVTVIVQPQAVAGPLPRPVRPLSYAPLDPTTIIGRSASGRVVAVTPGAYPVEPPPAPYAPPSFQIVGEASGRHMQRPVKLTYGVQPHATEAMGPKVIWLKEPKPGQPLITVAE